MPRNRYNLTVTIVANVGVYASGPEAATAAVADLLSEPVIRIRQTELVVEHAEVTGIYDAQWDEVEVKS